MLTDHCPLHASEFTMMLIKPDSPSFKPTLTSKPQKRTAHVAPPAGKRPVQACIPVNLPFYAGTAPPAVPVAPGPLLSGPVYGTRAPGSILHNSH